MNSPSSRPKQSLQERLANFQAQSQQEKTELEAEIQALKDQAVRLKTRIETARGNLDQAEERLRSNRKSQGILEATFTQADATLNDFGFDLGKGSDFAKLAPRGQIERLFEMGNRALERVGGVRREQGQFYLPDGTQVSGTIIRLGQVAAYGVSDQASGILVPAGGGALKLWKRPRPEVAEAVA